MQVACTTGKSLICTEPERGDRYTVSNILHIAQLQGRRPRKTQLLKPCHLKNLMKYANDNIQKPFIYWSRVLCMVRPNKNKIELFGHNESKYVFRKNDQRKNPKNTLPTVEHGGGSIMIWGSFSSSGVGSLHKVDGIMKKEDYLTILQTYLKEDARKLGLGCRWTFQHDRDPKHTAKIVTNWLQAS